MARKRGSVSTFGVGRPNLLLIADYATKPATWVFQIHMDIPLSADSAEALEPLLRNPQARAEAKRFLKSRLPAGAPASAKRLIEAL
jgi:hypothetical protein